MGRAKVPKAKEVQDTIICWQGDGHSTLGRKSLVIMLDLLPKRSTVTGVYSANLLDPLRTAIHEKRRGKLPKSVFAATGQGESPHLQSCNECCRANGYELIPYTAY